MWTPHSVVKWSLATSWGHQRLCRLVGQFIKNGLICFFDTPSCLVNFRFSIATNLLAFDIRIASCCFLRKNRGKTSGYANDLWSFRVHDANRTTTDQDSFQEMTTPLGAATNLCFYKFKHTLSLRHQHKVTYGITP